MARSMRVGVRDLFVAKATIGEDNKVTYDTPKAVGGTASVSVTENRGENKVYESDVLIRDRKRLSGATISYKSRTVALADEIDMIYGTEAETDGSFDIGVDEEPTFLAVGWYDPMSDGKWRCVWYYYCSGSKTDENHETATENETTPEDTYEFAAVPRPDTRKLKRIKICADESERDAFMASVTPAA